MTPAIPIDKNLVLAFDTANEIIAIGVGVLCPKSRTINLLAETAVQAHRASNTRLVPLIDDLFRQHNFSRDDVACVVCGRGPGSFTGVRIALATAKGIASALEVALVGVSTSDAVAWGMQDAGLRGESLVLSDAMRKEVYPVSYTLTATGAIRNNPDRVVKAEDQAREMQQSNSESLLLSGDALAKYADLFCAFGAPVSPELQAPSGKGLLLAAQAAWRDERCDPFDAVRHNPALLLPVYTRLSDAEENERIRLAKTEEKNLATGVQATENEITYRPLDAVRVADVAALEQQTMGSDAWSEASVADDLPRKDRVWWAAYAQPLGGRRAMLVGYAGGWVVDGQVQILKVACRPEYRRRGIARELLSRVADDARALGAAEATLEVRASNTGAIALYEALGFQNLGKRPRYYSDGEDAVIMTGPLPTAAGDVAGMTLQVGKATDESTEASPVTNHPLILAIESSCDETAAAVIDGGEAMLSDVVASQIDFHSRFGGVVPEIASRKHVEAICGVTQVCLEQAAEKLKIPRLRWRDLDAVAVTYAPGLVGALVVGVAFAKGAAWGADLPLIGVNHMEGHLYANKLANPDITVPMVVSLVSGGHTMLVHVRDWGDYRILGSTLDDAVGEAFDKVAKALGLGYPGGPIISRLAEQGNDKAIDFPRAMLHSGDLRFSLSGLKTAVTTYIQQQQQAGIPLNIPDIAASFTAAVVDVQVAKAMTAVKQTGVREFCVGGGVSANPVLRDAYRKACAKRRIHLTVPPLSACGDNAAMIALVALSRFEQGRFFGLDADAHAHTNLEEPY